MYKSGSSKVRDRGASGHAQSLKYIVHHFKEYVALYKVIVNKIDQVVGVCERVNDLLGL